ncbi:MAG: hypothetical protein LBR83_05835, partial [Clostridiales bacterium]|nr:hypothetical protein [Clostridiales bacterium]
MSLPTIPVNPETGTLESSISQILTSIAMEEIGLSHIINAEGEKLQYVLGTLTDTKALDPSISELLEINESVKEMLNAISTNQMFLFGKMSSALSAYLKNKNCPGADGKTPSSPITDTPQLTDGRLLGADKTGDSSDWVEIARNGNYSLIVRKQFINDGDPALQYTEYGATNDYGSSAVRQKINQWFTGETPLTNLRAYTVKNNAAAMLGAGTKNASGLTDSFSKPSAEFDSRGTDVAFALSYGEAANFLSKSYQWGGGTANQNNEAAVNNFAKLSIPEDGEGYDTMWLRSPGGSDNTASALFASGRV